MAVIKASTWERGFWDAAIQSSRQASEQAVLTSLGRINDGFVQNSSNTLVTGTLIPSGSFAIYGNGFETAIRIEDVSVSRITVNAPGLSFEMQGSLHAGGVLGIVGSISSASLVSDGLRATVTGDMRIGYYGNASAINTTEDVILANGFHQISRTDAAGNYVSHQAAFAGQNIDIQGTWAYGQVTDWADIFVGADTLHGTSGNDYLKGFAGNDVIYGNAGVDTAVFSGNRADYTAAGANYSSSIVTDSVPGRDGQDTLVGIERLKFANGTLALDIDGNAGQAYRIYKAALDRTPDLKGLGDWIYALDTGLNTLNQVADGFTSSAEFQGKYGVNTSNVNFITLLYNNVLDRNPDAAGLADWQRAFELGSSRSDVLIGFSESPENKANVISLIANGIRYDDFLG
jgi:hypothetical protein